MMKTSTSMKSIELKFKLGVPFQEDTTDGRKCETTVTMQDNKLSQAKRQPRKGTTMLQR